MNCVQHYLRKEQLPFTIPDPLKAVLLGYPLETGSGGGIGAHLPAVAVWSITNDAGSVVGAVWLNEQNEPNGEQRFFVNICVYDNNRSKGVGRCALRMLEGQLRKDGVQYVYAQINSNRQETGLRVRRWLHSEGYSLLREDVSARREHLSDKELIEKDPCALKFKKNLQEQN